jgi:hypothetical protein
MGEVPSRDLFEFDGTLSEKRISGNLLITNPLCGKTCDEKKKINLLRSKEWTSMMSEYQSYAEWKADADKILERRGPQW